MAHSTKTDPGTLDLERDLPTTAEDVVFLRKLRKTRIENPLAQVNRLRTPGWTLAAAGARPTFEGCEPFEL